MINLKSPSEIEIMREGGAKLKKVVEELLMMVGVGITTKQIDKKALELIEKNGAEPSFSKVDGYHWPTCISVNEQVVHTPPSSKKIEEGDVVTIDIGVFYKGFHTDFALSFITGEKKDPQVQQFLDVGKKALDAAISKAEKGRHLGDVSQAIENEITGHGFCILKELTGHGVGRELHEEPYVLGFVREPIEKTLVMRPGLVIAIEVIYSQSTEEIAYEKGNDWSIVTKDGSLGACFEHTVAITEKGTMVLT